MNLRRIFRLPDSFFGQLLLLLTLGFVIFHAANFAVVCNVQWLYVEQAEKSRAEHLASYWTLFNSMPRSQREAVVSRMSDAYESGAIKERLKLTQAAPDWSAEADHEVSRQLSHIRRIFENAGTQPPSAKARAIGDVNGLIRVHLPSLELAVEFSDGTWLQITTPYDVDDRALVWAQRAFLIVLALITLTVVIWLVRRMTRPIDDLSRAVEEFGRHPEIAKPLREEGVREIRTAAHSFNRMRSQIQGNMEERSRIIAAMTHDLRTPLTLIKGYAELMRDIPGEAEKAENFDVIIGEASRLTNLVNDMLDLSREQEKGEKMRLDTFDIVKTLSALVARHGKLIEHLGYKLEFEHEDRALVYADEQRITQVIYNLINNAVNYAGDDKLVIIKQYTRGSNVRIEVTDHGDGVDVSAQGDFSVNGDNHNESAIIAVSVVAGIGQGIGFTAGVTALLSRAGKELRAGTFSTIYLTSYGGAAIPNFVVGLLPGTHAVLDILSWYVILIAVMYAVMLVLSAKPYPEVQPEELIADA